MVRHFEAGPPGKVIGIVWDGFNERAYLLKACVDFRGPHQHEAGSQSSNERIQEANSDPY